MRPAEEGDRSAETPAVSFRGWRLSCAGAHRYGGVRAHRACPSSGRSCGRWCSRSCSARSTSGCSSAGRSGTNGVALLTLLAITLIVILPAVLLGAALIQELTIGLRQDPERPDQSAGPFSIASWRSLPDWGSDYLQIQGSWRFLDRAPVHRQWPLGQRTFDCWASAHLRPGCASMSC